MHIFYLDVECSYCFLCIYEHPYCTIHIFALLYTEYILCTWCNKTCILYSIQWLICYWCFRFVVQTMCQSSRLQWEKQVVLKRQFSIYRWWKAGEDSSGHWSSGGQQEAGKHLCVSFIYLLYFCIVADPNCLEEKSK